MLFPSKVFVNIVEDNGCRKSKFCGSGRRSREPVRQMLRTSFSHASRLIVSLLAVLFVHSAGTQPAASENAPRVCWSNSQLAHVAGEERVQRMVRAAFVDPPQRKLTPYVPLLPNGVVRRVRLPPEKKLVALTFDLCEEPFEIAGYQGGIVDYLRANNIKATFFAGGKWMLTHRSRAQQLMSDPLFAIGNHTWEHRNLRLLEGKALDDELKNAQAAYESVREDLAEKRCVRPGQATPAVDATRTRLELIRFPFGACNARALDAAAGLGLLPIQWDVSSGDAPPGQSPQEMLKDVLRGVRPGSIVLFHANGRGIHTTETIPIIVAALKAKGYEFVTVPELLKEGKAEIVPTCYDSRPGDADRYDGMAARLEMLYREARIRVLGNSPAQSEGIGAPGASQPSNKGDEINHSEMAPDLSSGNIPLPKPRPRE
jgi:peptidoglycan-N-acetylglucosamine deacetylase